MDLYLPDHVDWFELAEQVIRDQAKTSCSADATLSASTSRGPPPMTGSLPEGNDTSLNYDRLVEHMVVTPSSKLDPKTQWKMIHGNRQAKRVLHTNLVRSLRRGGEVNNVLLFGPAGTGKTMMLKCAATKANWTVIHITQNAIMQTYQGQSEKYVCSKFIAAAVGLTRVRVIAAIFQKASQCQPACIVIDEADCLFARRSAQQTEGARSIRCCLLEAMSRVMEDDDKRIMFIATTISPEDFDDAFIRSFPCCVYVKLPDRGAIMAMFKQHLEKYELDDDVTNQRLHNLATDLASKRTLSGYDIKRALNIELQYLLEESWDNATHFREVRPWRPFYKWGLLG